MLTLKKRPPHTYAHLLNGGFTVQKTTKVISVIAIDQAREQNNAMMKSDAGGVGLDRKICHSTGLDDFWSRSCKVDSII